MAGLAGLYQSLLQTIPRYPAVHLKQLYLLNSLDIHPTNEFRENADDARMFFPLYMLVPETAKGVRQAEERAFRCFDGL